MTRSADQLIALAISEALSCIEDYGVRQKLEAAITELEEDLVKAANLPPEKFERARRSIEAQMLGLLEMARLDAVKARSQLVLGALRAALFMARAIILKV